MNKPKVRQQPAALDGSDLYAAEAILDSRVEEDGTTKYLIKWLGWGMRHNTWEPPENIASESLIQDFDERKAQGLIHKQTKRRSSSSTKMSPNYRRHKRHNKSHKSTHKSNTSVALHSDFMDSHSYEDQITGVIQTKTYSECSTTIDLNPKPTPISVPSICSQGSARNDNAIPEPMTQSISPVPEPTQSEQIESGHQTSQEKIIKESSNSESKIPKTSATKNSADNKNMVTVPEMSGKLTPLVILEPLPKIVVKRYQNRYEIKKPKVNDNQSNSSNSSKTKDIKQKKKKKKTIVKIREQFVLSENSDEDENKNTTESVGSIEGVMPPNETDIDIQKAIDILDKNIESDGKVDECSHFINTKLIISEESATDSTKDNKIEKEKEKVINEMNSSDCQYIPVINDDNERKISEEKMEETETVSHETMNESQDIQTNIGNNHSNEKESVVIPNETLYEKESEKDMETSDDQNVVTETNSNELENRVPIINETPFQQTEDKEMKDISQNKNTEDIETEQLVSTPLKEVEDNVIELIVDNNMETETNFVETEEVVPIAIEETEIESNECVVDHVDNNREQTKADNLSETHLMETNISDEQIKCSEVADSMTSSSEVILPNCDEPYIEGTIVTEICEPIVVTNESTDVLFNSEEQTEENLDNRDDEEMVQITVQLTDENLELLKENEEFLVHIPEEIEETSLEDTPIEETPLEDTPIEETPLEDTPIEETPLGDTPIEETPLEDIPIEETPLEDIPIEETPLEDIPIEETTIENTPQEIELVETAIEVTEKEKPLESEPNESLTTNLKIISTEKSTEKSISEPVDMVTNETDVTSEDQSVSDEHPNKSSVVVDDVIEEEDREMETTYGPIANNDDEIDANLMIRQPSNETKHPEESEEELEECKVLEKSTDALKKSETKDTKRKVDIQDLNNNNNNNQNKCNKDNELLDLTFNANDMLDTVDNNYINACLIPGQKGVHPSNDSLSASLYSPISDDERDWSSAESQSSPETINEFNNNINNNIGKSVDQSKRVINVCERGGETTAQNGANGSEQFNVAQRQSSQTNEPMQKPMQSPPVTNKWMPQSDLIDNRVQTINYHSSLESAPRRGLVAAPDVTLSHNQSSVTCITSPLTSQAPTAQISKPMEALSIDAVQTHPKSQMGNCSNGELQATSAILSGILMDTSSQESTPLQNRLSPTTHQIQGKEDQSRRHLHKPMPGVGSPTPVITLLNPSSKPVQTSPPSIPTLPVNLRESSVADASNWPLLNQTNLPVTPTFRPTVTEHMSASHQPYVKQYMARPTPGCPSVPNMLDNHLRQMAGRPPMPPMPEPRRRGRPPSLPQVRNRPYGLPNTSYQQMTSTQIKHMNAPHFPTPIKAQTPMAPMMPRADILTSTSKPLTTDVRLASGYAQNVSARQHDLIRAPQYPAYPPPNSAFDYRSSVRQMSGPSYGQSNALGIQKVDRNPKIPFNPPLPMMRPSVPTNDFNPSLHHRPLNPQRPYQTPYQTMSVVMQRNTYPIPTPPTAHQTPFMQSSSDSSHRITVEPKQAQDIRDKIQTMSNSPFGCDRPRVGPQEFNTFMREYQRKVGNEDNLSNKERTVERILDCRFQMNDIPFPAQSHERQVLGQQNNNNLMNVAMNRNSNIHNNNEPNPQILRNVLSQSTDSLSSPRPNSTSNMCRESQLSTDFDINQNSSFDSLLLSDSLSPTNTSSRTSKSGDKDILSAAMEEIVEFTHPIDDDHMMSESFSNDNSEISDDLNRGQSASENCISIPNEMYETEKIIEYLKSKGYEAQYQSFEGNSQELELMNTSETNETVVNESQADDSLIHLQLDEFSQKMLQDAANNGNGEVMLVFDNENNNQNEDKSNTEVDYNPNLVSDHQKSGIVGNTVDDNQNLSPCLDNSIVETADKEQVVSDLINQNDSIKESDASDETKRRTERTEYVSMPTFVFDGKQKGKNETSIPQNEGRKDDTNVENMDISENNKEIEDQKHEENESSKLSPGFQLEMTDDKAEGMVIHISNAVNESIETKTINKNVCKNVVNHKNDDKNECNESHENINIVQNKNTEQNNTIIDTNVKPIDEKMDESFVFDEVKSDSIVTNDEPVCESVTQTQKPNTETDVKRKEVLTTIIEKSTDIVTSDEDEDEDERPQLIINEEIESCSESIAQNITQNEENIERKLFIDLSGNETDPTSYESDKEGDKVKIDNEKGTEEEVLVKGVNNEEMSANVKEMDEKVDSDIEMDKTSNERISEKPVLSTKCENNDRQTSKDNSTEDNLKEINNEEMFDDISNDKMEETITEKIEEALPLGVVPSERVQHPVVSSSVEDFMPNSPSTLSPKRCSPLILTKASDQTKGLVDMDKPNPIRKPLTETHDSDDGVLPHPTTTTITTKNSSNSVQINDDANKSSTNISLFKRKVPQKRMPQKSATIDTNQNKSEQSKKSSKSGEKRKSKLSSKPPKKMTITKEEEREFLHIIKSKPTGWDRGLSPEEIVGINSLNSTLVFLVKWSNGEQTIVLSEVAKHRCPQLVIQFYERHSVWDE